MKIIHTRDRSWSANDVVVDRLRPLHQWAMRWCSYQRQNPYCQLQLCEINQGQDEIDQVQGDYLGHLCQVLQLAGKNILSSGQLLVSQIIGLQLELPCLLQQVVLLVVSRLSCCQCLLGLLSGLHNYMGFRIQGWCLLGMSRPCRTWVPFTLGKYNPSNYCTFQVLYFPSTIPLKLTTVQCVQGQMFNEEWLWRISIWLIACSPLSVV